MKRIKRFALWLVFMLVIALAVDGIGAFISTRFGVNVLEGAYEGYSKKSENMIAPVRKEKDEKNRTNGLSGLAVRAIIEDNRLETHDNIQNIFFFTDYDVDESHIFLSKDGMNELSKGIFAEVYDDLGDGNDYIKNAVGVVDMNAFAKLDCAKEVYKLYEKDENYVIKVNTYSVSNYIVSLGSFTVTDSLGNEIQSFECPCEGDIIKSDKTYIHGSILHKLKTAYLGERKVDRLANELVSKVDFSAEQRYTKRSYGLASVTSKHVETTGENGQVSVLRISYLRSFLLYFGVWGAVTTLIFLLVCRKKDKSRDSDFYY